MSDITDKEYEQALAEEIALEEAKIEEIEKAREEERKKTAEASAAPEAAKIAEPSDAEVKEIEMTMEEYQALKNV